MGSIIARVFAVLLVSGIVNFIRQRMAYRAYLKTLHPLSTIPAPTRTPYWVEADHTTILQSAIAGLQQMAWGAEPVDDAQGIELYRKGHVALIEMSGAWSKAPDIAQTFLHCPRSLAYTGVAEVIYTISYVSGFRYAPLGIAVATDWTSAAIAADPLRPEPWIERTRILSKGQTKAHLLLAEMALQKARELDPLHPHLPSAENAYYTGIKDYRAAEAAILRGLNYAAEGRISRIERRALLNNLAMNYDIQRRPAEALATYQQLTTEFPEYAWGWHNGSRALLISGQLEEALHYNERAIAIMPFPLALQANAKIRERIAAKARSTPTTA